jgi:PhzF family phenazine biosynthesis protein
MKPVTVLQIDSFADKPFTGNPAAVCLMDEPAPDEWLQNVAMEMNLSETAFVWKDLTSENGFKIRWMTPLVEVDLCGHATLAACHALWQTGMLSESKEAVFQSRSGELRGRKAHETIWLDFPAAPQTPTDAPEGMIEALGVDPIHVGRNDWDFLVVVESESEVLNAKPDFTKLAMVDSRGVILTAKSDPNLRSTSEYDFVSRGFFPATGIDEDPVTGSAHCCLAPYWSTQFAAEQGDRRTNLVGFQASKRGGLVQARLVGDRVHLGGSAITVMQGNLFSS